jgi:hypothetical protein
MSFALIPVGIPSAGTGTGLRVRYPQKTRTLMAGTGFCRVRVRVRPLVPRGLPVQIPSHKPGRLHGKPDALSRRADHGRGESDNRDHTLLRPEWFRTMAIETTLPGDELVERI